MTDYLEKAKDSVRRAMTFDTSNLAEDALALAVIALVDRLDKLTATDGDGNKAIRVMEAHK